MSIVLGDLERHREALRSALEAIKIRRNLATKDCEIFDPKLASSLINLGLQYGRLGELESALQATREAVAIRRKIAKDRIYSPGLALALNNLAVQLTRSGDTQQALEIIQEAVDIWRSLVNLRPDRFLPDLARSLQNLGRILRTRKLYDDALRAIIEASKIHEQLEDRRADFRPHLAASLNDQLLILEEMGRIEEASLVRGKLKTRARWLKGRCPRRPDGDDDGRGRGTDSDVSSTVMADLNPPEPMPRPEDSPPPQRDDDDMP